MASASRSPLRSVWARVALCAAFITAWAFASPPLAGAHPGHDHGPVELPAAMEIEPFAAVVQQPRFDVLVFSRTTGFRHAEAIDAGHAAIEQMGAELGREFNVTASEDAGLFTDAGLRPYEVIVLLNIDGEGILNGAQRTAFERWAQRGGGIVGIHACRQRGPQLGVDGRHDGRRLVPKPPERRQPVPDRDRERRGRCRTRRRHRCQTPGCAKTSGTTSPPSRAARCTSC